MAKQPPRRVHSTRYDFQFYWDDEALKGKPLIIRKIEIEAYNFRSVHVNIQGKILTRDLQKVAQIHSDLSSFGKGLCDHPGHSIIISQIGGYGANYKQPKWEEDCNFYMTMSTAQIQCKRRSGLDKGVAQLFEILAKMLGFENLRPKTKIYHTYLYLINQKWISEGDNFLNLIF